MRNAVALVLFAAACGSSKTPVVTQTPPDQGSATQTDHVQVMPQEPEAPGKPIKNTTLAAIGLDPAALDKNADPCEDFFQFACGGWIAKTEIQPDLPIAMRSFVDIELQNEAYLHDVLEKAAKGAKESASPSAGARSNAAQSIEKQVGDYYAACMNETAIEKAGLAPVKPLLAQIAKVKDSKSLSAAVSFLATHNVQTLFSFGPTEDFADVTKMIGSIDQAGLGLPDRDYYLVDDDKNNVLRAAYTEYLAALLVEAGHKADAAKKEANEILALETEIAKAHKDKVAMRDPKGVYNKIDRAGVSKAAPHFDWDGYFKTIGQPDLKDITVSAPAFLTGLDALIEKTPAATWRNYLTAHTLGNTAPLLTKKLEDISFKLEQKIIGAAEQRARWKRCVGHTDNALPEALGQIYVRDRFPGASKTAAEEQVHAIVAAMNKNIDALAWMDAATKTKAHEKAAAMAYHIGYPDKWRTYAFKIDAKTFAANAFAARKAERARVLAKIGKPVDREVWEISASMVNAFYQSTHNKMVFPAGILQNPFYQVDHSIAVNLGAMGMVVGHELTHGFDDRGAQFDAKGNMTNWWAPETEKKFKERTRCVVDQYAKYEAGGAKVNGELTLGENIADIGGLKLALAAYRSLRSTAPDTDVADGFTEDQQFFLSFGQAWCAKMRPEYESMLVTVDSHSPAKWRVNGALSATPDFAKAFRCKLGAKLKPRDACSVW